MPTLETTYRVTLHDGGTQETTLTLDDEARLWSQFRLRRDDLIAATLLLDASEIASIEPVKWKKLVLSASDESQRTEVIKLQNRMIKLVRSLDVKEFTLEHGVGSTYGHTDAKPTLYGHGEYPSYSVMAGRNRRVYIRQFNSIDEARAMLASAKIKYDDLMDDGGSTYVDIDTLTAHLPDDQG